MEEAYRLSNSLLRERLSKEDSLNTEILKDLKQTDIIVVEGSFDYIHNVLSLLEIPFTKITREQLANVVELNPKQTVYVNCPTNFPLNAAQKLSDFVLEGGLLITTDWALKHVIEAGFPGTIKWNGLTSGDQVVSIEVVDKQDEVVKGFVDEDSDAKPQWWLESSSYPIQIIDPSKVDIIVRSDELKEMYREEAVIVKIKWGKGLVYHMISHFYLQKSVAKDKKHTMNAGAYAEWKGASEQTLNDAKAAKYAKYNDFQSAETSAEVITRAFLSQKKKNFMKEKSDDS